MARERLADLPLGFDPHRRGGGLTVARYRFDNGLSLLVAPDHAAPVVCMQTWLAVGSRHERPGKTGIAHLFEHLMFGATRRTPFGAFDRMIEEAGGDTNGATWLDWTYYECAIPAEAWPLVIDLEADRFAHLVLEAEPVEREREVVMNERRETVEDDVEELVSERLYLEAMSVHGYRHPTIGHMVDIAGLTIEDCRAFYATYYAPNNATLVVVGDVTPDAVAAEVERRYGALPSSTLPPLPDDVEPPATAKRLRMGVPTDLARLVMGFRAPAVGHPDHPAAVVLNEMLTGGAAGWAHRRLVEDMAIAQEVQGDVGFFRDPSLWELMVVAEDEETSPSALEGPLLDVLDEVAERVDDDAVERVCRRLELRALQEMVGADGRAEQIGFGQVVLGDPAWMAGRIARYRAVAADDVIAVAARYLDPARATTIEVWPTEDAPEVSP